MYNIESLISLQYCYDGLIQTQLPIQALLYAHIPSAFFALVFCLYVTYKKRSMISSSLLIVCFLFALWSFLDLNAWFSFMGAENTMFTWSLTDLVALLFFFFSYRFLYQFIYSKEIPVRHALFGFILVLPTFIVTALGLNLIGFDATYCEAIENPAVTQYTYIAQAIILIAVMILGYKSSKNEINTNKKRQIQLASVGVASFLLFFFSATFIVNLLTNYTNIQNPYSYEIYGLFGMPILLVFLGYLIVRYKAFSIKLVGAQAIVSMLVLLDASQIFFSSSTTETIVNIATIAFVLIFGILLVNNIKKEILQREEIEKLAQDLQNANLRLKDLDKMKTEFVSIASHQLRSPLTSIRGYTSMLQEGSYGKLPAKAQEVISKISDSSKYMALSIEDYLNVSRIEAGNMRYEMSDFNAKELVEKIVDEMRPIAIKKGLVMVFRSDCNGSCAIHADIGKTRQIVMNLLDNSMKYTPKGTITVVVHDDVKKKILSITVQDTGVGMSEETMETLFEKFVRAKNANCVNVTGTGLGLYVAKKMVTEMGAKIWLESEGEGKGSTFHVEFPLLAGKSKAIK